MNLGKITATKGALVKPAWEAMLEFIRTTGVVRGPGVRVRVTPHGTYVSANGQSQAWRGAFHVSNNGARFSVGEGSVNGVTPYIDGVPVSGVDADGGIVDVPEIEVSHSGGSVSYIALRVLLEESGGALRIGDAPEFTSIIHTDFLDEGFAEGGSQGASAIYPLAKIYWSGKGVVRKVFQITHHNLGHRYLKGSIENGLLSRHFFWAA